MGTLQSFRGVWWVLYPKTFAWAAWWIGGRHFWLLARRCWVGVCVRECVLALCTLPLAHSISGFREWMDDTYLLMVIQSALSHDCIFNLSAWIHLHLFGFCSSWNTLNDNCDLWLMVASSFNFTHFSSVQFCVWKFFHSKVLMDALFLLSLWASRWKKQWAETEEESSADTLRHWPG